MTGGTEGAMAGVCGPVSLTRAVDSVSGQTKATQDIALAPRNHAFYRKDLSRRIPWLENGNSQSAIGSVKPLFISSDGPASAQCCPKLPKSLHFLLSKTS